MSTSLSRWTTLAAVTAVAAVSSCGPVAAPKFASNVATMRLVEGQIIRSADGAPYTGTLVARDGEIATVARVVLTEGTFAGIGEVETGGLILVIPVENGLPDGRARVAVELGAPRIAGEVTRIIGTELLVLARAFSPILTVAEATFVKGKLEGTAVVHSPAADGKGITKRAEVELHDNFLDGDALEYHAGSSRVRRHFRFRGGRQHGPQQWFYSDGTPERTATFVDGEPDGELLEYYASGARRAHAIYDRGALIGTSEEWFPSGQLARETIVDGDQRRVRGWYSSGQLAFELSPELGLREHPADGVVEEFHASGALRTRTSYAAGVQDGAFTSFYASGKPHTQGSFTAGKQSGAYQKWWTNGQLALSATYVNGELDGAFARYYANGTPWERATYVAGKLDGDYRRWWKNGTPAHVYAYHLGKLDGDYLLYYDSGATWATGKYVEGKPQGLLQRWFPDGRLGYVMHHEHGRPHGPFQRWYADGTPRLQASYDRGQLHGELENWLEDGSVYERATYQHGVKVQTTRTTAATP